MKRHFPTLVYLVLLQLLIPSVNAQDHIVYQETYDSDKGWSPVDKDNYAYEVKEGSYQFTYKKEKGYRYQYWKKCHNANQDWILSADLTALSYDDYGCAGLIFGCDRLGGFYHVKINTYGKFELGHVNYEDYESISPWQKHPAVKTGKATNRLEIAQQGKQLVIRINGTQVFSTKKVALHGCGIGYFIGFTPATYAFDNLTLKDTPHKVAYVDGYDEPKAKKNLGEAVNTKYDERGAVVSPDGKELFFVSRTNPLNKEVSGTDNTVIFRSVKNEDGTWSPKAPLPAPVTSKGNNFMFSIGAGNTSYLLINKYLESGWAESGMSVTHRSKKGWTFPEALEFEGLEETPGDYTSACWSANGKVLIYSMNRYDGQGQMDLLVSFHIRKNKWSKLVNMGPVINGIGDEFTPFLAADDKTLYFASQSHGGYGGSDIWVSHRLDDTWLNWSTPKNLGPYINSPEKQSFFSIGARGEKGYICSAESGYGMLDIFEIELSEGARPDPVLLLKGQVKDGKTGELIDAQISLRDIHTDTELGLVWSAPEDGHYEMALPEPKEYVLFAQREGYYAHSATFTMDEAVATYTEKVLNLELLPIEKGAKIELSNIFFVQSKAVILPKSLPELNRLAELLQENQRLHISIQGHTDNTGSARLNQQLSEDRAKKIKSYLVEQGIDKKRLKAQGFGGSEPAYSNSTEEGRKQNRRVEFVVTKN